MTLAGTNILASSNLVICILLVGVVGVLVSIALKPAPGHRTPLWYLALSLLGYGALVYGILSLIFPQVLERFTG